MYRWAGEIPQRDKKMPAQNPIHSGQFMPSPKKGDRCSTKFLNFLKIVELVIIIEMPEVANKYAIKNIFIKYKFNSIYFKYG